VGGRLAAVLGLGALAVAAPPSAARFEHCPIGAKVPGHRPLGREGVGACAELVAKSGFMRIGSTQQQLTHPIVEQFGFVGDVFLAPSDGTPWMSTTPEQIPGGMFGVPLGPSTDVTVRVLPAGAMRFSVFEPTTLPVRFKVDNDFLGPSCFIGPVVLHLRPDVSKADVSGEGPGIRMTGLVASDTTFAVPKSNGCNGGGLVDAKLGLPSPPGANAVRLEIDAAVASASRVARTRRAQARARARARRHAPRRP
jgi:hypothetical protein